MSPGDAQAWESGVENEMLDRVMLWVFSFVSFGTLTLTFL